MKTSLNIDDILFKEAGEEARREGKTIGETISGWARAGRRALLEKRRAAKRRKAPRAVDLGGPAMIDLGSRRDWMDSLEDDRR
mgnify:CR=1 FL=1